MIVYDLLLLLYNLAKKVEVLYRWKLYKTSNQN